MKQIKHAKKGISLFLVIALLSLCCACSGKSDNTGSKLSGTSENIVSDGNVTDEYISDVDSNENVTADEIGSETVSKHSQSNKTSTTSKNSTTRLPETRTVIPAQPPEKLLLRLWIKALHLHQRERLKTIVGQSGFNHR